MILLRLEGGLGNIMFQYGLGRRLALRHGVELKYDISSYQTNPLGDASFYLEVFEIDIANHLATTEEIASFVKYKPKQGRRWTLYNALFANKRKYVIEKGPYFQPYALLTGPHAYIHGWWQNEKYFADIRDILLKDFTFRNQLIGKNKETAERIRASNSISMHVRRLDFVTNPKTRAYHGELSKDYYDRALTCITQKIPNPVLFVFSDDIPWVEKNFSFPYETVYVGWNQEEEISYVDMHLMSLCKYHIIANSAFSWWGAWLSSHTQKIVVAPERWTNDPLDTNERVPLDWIKIANEAT